jgi:hypothetical protein
MQLVSVSAVLRRAGIGYQQGTAMTLDLSLRSIDPNLLGTRATDDDVHLLKSRLPSRLTPDWLMALLRGHALAGVGFSLSADHDESGIGAEVIWLTPEQMVSESVECEPGRSVLSYGFLAIGACAEGSGDPYFLNLSNPSDDPPLVRIPHDYAVSVSYPRDKIEIVTSNLSALFRNSSINS